MIPSKIAAILFLLVCVLVFTGCRNNPEYDLIFRNESELVLENVSVGVDHTKTGFDFGFCVPHADSGFSRFDVPVSIGFEIEFTPTGANSPFRFWKDFRLTRPDPKFTRVVIVYDGIDVKIITEDENHNAVPNGFSL